MVFDFLASGIALFDDTFNTIKGLFANCVENTTPANVYKVGIGRTSTAFYVRWYVTSSTYYFLHINPTATNADNKAYFSYYDGTNNTRLLTFTVT